MAVNGSGRALARLLHRMHWKFKGDAASIANPFADPLGEFQMVPIAGREVRTALGDAHDRLGGCEFLLSQAKIEVALEIERCHTRIVGIVEPQLRAQAPSIPSHRRASIPSDCGVYIGRLGGCVAGNRTRSELTKAKKRANAKATMCRTHCIALMTDRTVTGETTRL